MSPPAGSKGQPHQVHRATAGHAPGLGGLLGRAQIDVTTALVVLSEIGTDMTRFAAVMHFTSWLGLCPSTPRITGGKILSRRTRRCTNGAAQACGWPWRPALQQVPALGAYFPFARHNAEHCTELQQ